MKWRFDSSTPALRLRRRLRPLAAAVACAVLTAWLAPAVQAQDAVRIGYISDLSGVYLDVEGKGGAVALQMAIDDYGGKVLGRPVELLVADHQNKADMAASKAREWFDLRDMQMLVSGATTGPALAMAKVAEEKKRVLIENAAGAAALTNEQCSPYTIHYAYDMIALAKGTGNAVVDSGGKTWFFLTADYAFGHELQRNTTKVVEAKGGKVLGSVNHPLNASDFSSFIMQAQGSKAQILAFADAGGDFNNAVKAARDFGVTKDMKLVGMVMFTSDIHSLGLKLTEGLMFTDSWYWDRNPESRKFSDRFFEKFKKMPTSLQAADYSAMMNYLKAVDAVKTTDADTVMAYFKSRPLDDFYAKGVIRPDGRYAHDMYLMQVKSPAESKGPWDYVKMIKMLTPDQVWTTKEESTCKLWK